MLSPTFVIADTTCCRPSYEPITFEHATRTSRSSCIPCISRSISVSPLTLDSCSEGLRLQNLASDWASSLEPGSPGTKVPHPDQFAPPLTPDSNNFKISGNVLPAGLGITWDSDVSKENTSYDKSFSAPPRLRDQAILLQNAKPVYCVTNGSNPLRSRSFCKYRLAIPESTLNYEPGAPSPPKTNFPESPLRRMTPPSSSQFVDQINAYTKDSFEWLERECRAEGIQLEDTSYYRTSFERRVSEEDTTSDFLCPVAMEDDLKLDGSNGLLSTETPCTVFGNPFSQRSQVEHLRASENLISPLTLIDADSMLRSSLCYPSSLSQIIGPCQHEPKILGAPNPSTLPFSGDEFLFEITDSFLDTDLSRYPSFPEKMHPSLASPYGSSQRGKETLDWVGPRGQALKNAVDNLSTEPQAGFLFSPSQKVLLVSKNGSRNEPLNRQPWSILSRSLGTSKSLRRTTSLKFSSQISPKYNHKEKSRSTGSYPTGIGVPDCNPLACWDMPGWQDDPSLQKDSITIANEYDNHTNNSSLDGWSEIMSPQGNDKELRFISNHFIHASHSFSLSSDSILSAYGCQETAMGSRKNVPESRGSKPRLTAVKMLKQVFVSPFLSDRASVSTNEVHVPNDESSKCKDSPRLIGNGLPYHHHTTSFKVTMRAKRSLPIGVLRSSHTDSRLNRPLAGWSARDPCVSRSPVTPHLSQVSDRLSKPVSH